MECLSQRPPPSASTSMAAFATPDKRGRGAHVWGLGEGRDCSHGQQEGNVWSEVALVPGLRYQYLVKVLAVEGGESATLLTAG